MLLSNLLELMDDDEKLALYIPGETFPIECDISDLKSYKMYQKYLSWRVENIHYSNLYKAIRVELWEV